MIQEQKEEVIQSDDMLISPSEGVGLEFRSILLHCLTTKYHETFLLGKNMLIVKSNNSTVPWFFLNVCPKSLYHITSSLGDSNLIKTEIIGKMMYNQLKCLWALRW